ncbi:GtrA family protein [Corynebacterium sp. TAE3-ERU12]|nr:GtrA family protein [Corynebacterium sp. TAE3-ERU12]
MGMRRQLTFFIISGVIAAVVDFSTTWLLLNVLVWTPFAAKTGGWVLGTITAYLINLRWTFQASFTVKRTVAVAALYIITFITQTQIFVFLLPVLANWGWQVYLAQFGAFVVAQGVATVVNFIVQRTVIFRVR